MLRLKQGIPAGFDAVTEVLGCMYMVGCLGEPSVDRTSARDPCMPTKQCSGCTHMSNSDFSRSVLSYSIRLYIFVFRINIYIIWCNKFSGLEMVFR